jgi:hypothetical protein
MRVGSLHMNDLRGIQHQSDRVHGYFYRESVDSPSEEGKGGNLPVTPNDCHVFWVLLVRVLVLLGHVSAYYTKVEPAYSYNAIVGRELMLLVKCDILITEEHHAPLRLLAKLSDPSSVTGSACTSATSNANSSFCASVNLLNWTPFNSVPMCGVTSSSAKACANRDAFVGSAKNARSRAGENSLSGGSGGVYDSTAGDIPLATMIGTLR